MSNSCQFLRGALCLGSVAGVALASAATLVLVAPGADATVPANGFIYFDDATIGHGEIFRINPDGSGLTQLTFDSGSWTADGSAVDYVHAGDIYQVSTGTTHTQTDLTKTTSVDESLPGVDAADGTIAYDRDSGIWTMTATGGSQAHLNALDPDFPDQPAWSPDGQTLAFIGSQADLWTYSSATATQLTTSTDVFAGEPAWAPDGSELVIQGQGRPDRTTDDLYTVDAATGAETKIANTSGANNPSWGPLVSDTLTVSKAGDGTGTVTSDVGGIDCGAACTASFPDCSNVVLTSEADAGAVFAGWHGCPSWHSDDTCHVTVASDTSVTAQFQAATDYGLLNIYGQVFTQAGFAPGAPATPKLPLSGAIVTYTSGSTSVSTTTDSAGIYHLTVGGALLPGTRTQSPAAGGCTTSCSAMVTVTSAGMTVARKDYPDGISRPTTRLNFDGSATGFVIAGTVRKPWEAAGSPNLAVRVVSSTARPCARVASATATPGSGSIAPTPA